MEEDAGARDLSRPLSDFAWYPGCIACVGNHQAVSHCSNLLSCWNHAPLNKQAISLVRFFSDGWLGTVFFEEILDLLVFVSSIFVVCANLHVFAKVFSKPRPLVKRAISLVGFFFHKGPASDGWLGTICLGGNFLIYSRMYTISSVRFPPNIHSIKISSLKNIIYLAYQVKISTTDS